MGTLTIRTNEAQEKSIDTLKRHYGETVSTKVVMRACVDVPKLAEQIQRLEQALEIACDQIDQYENASSTLLESLDTLRSCNEAVNDSKKARRFSLQRPSLLSL